MIFPVSADAATVAAAKVIPVAPVNPVVSPFASAIPVEPTPSIINLVNTTHKPSPGEVVYTSVSDPARRGSEAATAEKDWTIHRPAAPEKVEDPPPPPMYQLLMDHVKSMWTASASAIQVEQVKNQLEASQPNQNATPGVLATEVFTYSPSKINKTEQI